MSAPPASLTKVSVLLFFHQGLRSSNQAKRNGAPHQWQAQATNSLICEMGRSETRHPCCPYLRIPIDTTSTFAMPAQWYRVFSHLHQSLCPSRGITWATIFQGQNGRVLKTPDYLPKLLQHFRFQLQHLKKFRKYFSIYLVHLGASRCILVHLGTPS